MAGIPYMGSKRKLAPKILDYIIAHNPNAKYFYDLFGGGGAISFEALKRSFEVHYNELNTGVVALLEKIQQDGITPDFYQWVSREDFHKHKNDDDWFGGLCKTVWSFGNCQRTYLFGSNIEPLKKLAHDYLLQNGYAGEKEKRIRLLKEFKNKMLISGSFQLQQLERLQQLELLQQLQQLQQLEQLPLINNLIITNQSYINVNITTPINETVIYCDPPYKSTAQYKEKLDHDIFNEWVKNSHYKIYVSSYESELNCGLEMKHRSSLCSNKKNAVTEKLFCNQIETITKQDFKLI